MKYCPTCQTEYDEEILRFCTKDGTPLIDETQPHFTELPSVSAEEEADDFGEETLVRKEKPLNPPPMDIVEDTAVEPDKDADAPRIVIPTQEQQIRAKTNTYRPVPPPKSNTALVVVTTILLTVVVLGGIAALFWAFNGNNNGANVNVNTNPPDNLNVNTNSIVNIPPTNFDYNINSNYNFNSNINTNFNTNIKTPTPTKSPSPSASPNASPDANTNTNTNTRTPTPSRTPAPSPSASPRTTPSDEPTLRPVNAGVLNGRAINLPKPAYPSSAKQVGANGQVSVQVTVDESGNVTSAKATSGHPLLRQSAEAAARQTRFNPITVGNQSVKASGILLYNFVNQ
jgi:TonB family protein